MLAINNEVSIHNPNNIEANKIIDYLNTKHKGIFDISYKIRKNEWISNDLNTFDSFNNEELLTVHVYHDLIKGKHEERSMNDVRIIGLKEGKLHSLENYIEASSMITNLHELSNYLQQNVIPIVADFPGQLFFRKLISKLLKSEDQNLNHLKVKNFVPLLGPLHVSLNSREQTVLLHHKFFEKMFHYVFGDNKVLAKKPMPWRINILLELAAKGMEKISQVVKDKFGNECKDVEYTMALDLLENIIPATLDIYAILFRSGKFEEYLETIFRIWTFALRWKRKNYNKIPLMFISDYIYWKENNHPMAETLEKYLVNFNEYYVENFHSKLRANINTNQSTESIIDQAYIIGKL